MSRIVKLSRLPTVSLRTGQMPKVSAQDAALALLAIALVFIVLFWRLGTPTFWDPDEAHYAETSREMIATSDWSAPFYNEQPFFDKPVLFHQLQATAMRLCSDPELGARLVPALAALGLVAITVWFGTVMMSREVGIVAGLMLRRLSWRLRPRAVRHPRHALHHVHVRRRRLSSGRCTSIDRACSGWATWRSRSACRRKARSRSFSAA